MKTTCKKCNGWGRIKEMNPITGKERSVNCPTCKGSRKAENFTWPVPKKEAGEIK